MTARRKLGLFLVAFVAYLLLGSREPPWTDARPIYAVAQSIVSKGGLDAGIWTGLTHEGQFYAQQPLITSLVHVPGAALEKILVKRYPTASTPIRAIASHIGPAAMGALTCLLFALLLTDLGRSTRTALIGALLLGATTFVAVYARSPYSEITQTAAFLGFYVFLLRLVRWPTAGTAVAFGAFAGFLINTKVVFVLALPGAVAFAAILLWRRHGHAALLRAAGHALLGGAPFLIMLLAYNAIRTGSPFNNGYPAIDGDRQWNEHLWVGLWGLFLSPGKSLFLYSPPLVAGLLALPRALSDRHRDWLWAALLTAGPVVLLYARIFAWHGDWAWGPRYIVFLVPLMLLPALLWFPHPGPRRPKAAAALLALLGALGLWVQVLGGAFYWDHFLRIDHEVRPQWLGQPNRAGAASKDRGGWCDPCVEDLYGLNWLPAFSPLAGHAWLWRHVNAGHRWPEARLDAPWSRYTTLPLNAVSSYHRVRVDWWWLDFKDHRRKAGFILLGGWLALGALGAHLLRRPGQPGRAPRLRKVDGARNRGQIQPGDSIVQGAALDADERPAP